MEDLNDHSDRNARLELNARGYRPDPGLERVSELFYSDRAAWDRLSPGVKSAAQVHSELRAHHDAAVAAGVIPGAD